MTADGDLNAGLSRTSPAPSVSLPVDTGSPPAVKEPVSRFVRELIETLLLAALIFFLVRLVVLNFRVDGESMLPNFDDGQMLLVNRNAYEHLDINGNVLTNPISSGSSGSPETKSRLVTATSTSMARRSKRTTFRIARGAAAPTRATWSFRRVRSSSSAITAAIRPIRASSVRCRSRTSSARRGSATGRPPTSGSSRTSDTTTWPRQ
jgi:hypothetical protein